MNKLILALHKVTDFFGEKGKKKAKESIKFEKNINLLFFNTIRRKYEICQTRQI
jgi:hypothetical protein